MTQYSLGCLRQYFEFLNEISPQLDAKLNLQISIPSEVFFLISEFCSNITLVVENGSGFIKGGIAGYENPKTIFKTSIVRYWRPDAEAQYIGGDEPGNLHHRVPRFFSTPIERGIITNWDDIEKIWRHTFYNDLRVTPEDHPIVLLETPKIMMNPKAHRERVMQIMFNIFKVSAIYFYNEAVLSLYVSNRTTGCVMDSGYGVTCIVPIYEGYAIQHAIVHLDIGGSDLTNCLSKLIYERDANPLGNISYEISKELIVDMKECLCFVSLDFEKDMILAAESSIFEKAFELPDGSIIKLNNERFRCPEIIFQPNLNDLKDGGIARATYQSILKCDDVDVQAEMFESIILSGGNTLFPGFYERMLKEITTIIVNEQQSMSVNIVALENRKLLSWFGGSILASLSQAQLRMGITREEYDTFGPEIIHSKCF